MVAILRVACCVAGVAVVDVLVVGQIDHLECPLNSKQREIIPCEKSKGDQH